ncbi:MAG: hypothetical protein B7Z47_01315 [Chthoniobacter sp. 12-60-6]|nr:MAG: hypothetical protein B7Z47_01315 [Chthoniobacter sp. 12-60-6]
MRAAADTNFLLKLAAGSSECLECWGRIRECLPSPELIVLPTVLQELAVLKIKSPSLEVREYAANAEASLLQWGMSVQTLTPVEHGLAEQIGSTIRSRGLLPWAERNDGLIIAEAALMQCDFLVSSDGHFMTMNKVILSQILRDAHVKETLPVNPYLVKRVLT